MYNSFII